jgi:hypothetical protein
MSGCSFWDAGDVTDDASPGFAVLADRVHRHNYPLDLLFLALTAERDRWLRLAPGEVAPRLIEAVEPVHVVWSSLWPVSPNDRIELDLSLAESKHVLFSVKDNDRGPQSLLRLQWLSDSPPDARGIGITRQRLNQKFGGDLRGITSVWYWLGRSSRS